MGNFRLRDSPWLWTRWFAYVLLPAIVVAVLLLASEEVRKVPVKVGRQRVTEATLHLIRLE